MDEDFYDEMSDASVEASDEEVRPAYVGVIQPYMFEPTMTTGEAAAHETAVKKIKSVFDDRRLQNVSEWYGV